MFSLEGITAEERFERRAGLGESAGVEVGLAAGVELVGRRLVRIGVRLAGRPDPELAGLAEVIAARLVGAPHRGGQGAVVAGDVAEDVVGGRAGVDAGREVEG